MANISFGEQMRRNRIKNAWSQVELGEKLGVSQATISTWEIGRVVPDRDQQTRLREVLSFDQTETVTSGTRWPNVDRGEEVGPSAFGSWLNRARLEKGLSVGELSSKAEVSVAAMLVRAPAFESVFRIMRRNSGSRPLLSLRERTSRSERMLFERR
jgi:DNA-binding XRE family transcriptional regulator